MPWRVVQIEVLDLTSEGERMKTYLRQLLFTYGIDSLILLSVVVPMVNLNPRSFKSSQSLSSNISKSTWYFWKELHFCKKLVSWGKGEINT